MVSRTVLPRAARERICAHMSAAGFDVEADGGLVEEDEVGVAGEGEREEDALLLAAGELAEEAVFDAFERGGLMMSA